jgi:hypothetical protein
LVGTTKAAPGRRLRAAVLAVLVSPFPLAAQTTFCDSLSGQPAKVCGAAFDGATTFLPAAGILMAGGNPVLGTASASGRFASSRLILRGQAAQVNFPDTRYDGTSDTVKSGKRLTLVAPRLDLAFGVFSKKLPQGPIAIDLLGSVVLMPTGLTARFRVDPNAHQVGSVALGFAYGIRAALANPPPKPSVSFSFMMRNLPTVIYGDVAAGDQYAFSFNPKAMSVRLMAGRKFGPLDISGGAGMDLLSASTTATVRDTAVAGGVHSITASIKTSRIMTALNLGIDLPVFRLGGEFGFQVGKNDQLTTVFDRNDTKSGKFYGGVGLGIKL